MPLATLRAAHGLRPMSGRDPQEQARVATPLELLFDLTFVVARQCRQPDGAHGRRGALGDGRDRLRVRYFWDHLGVDQLRVP